MTRFAATNDMTSPRSLFWYRALYQLRSFERFPDQMEQVNDFNFTEETLYGRINTIMDTVVVNEEYLKNIPSMSDDTVSLRLLDFVADAYQNVVDAITRACRIGIVPTNDRFLSGIRGYRAYRSPTEEYYRYMEDVIDEYHSVYLVDDRNKQNILNFKDYMQGMMRYIKTSEKIFFPITFTSWQRSRTSSIFTSGLAIDISNLPIDNDPVKQTAFLNNQIFPHFLNVCKAHGFQISKNAPWLLVADIMSPLMRRYAIKYGMGSPFQVFASRYDLAYTKDLDLLKDIMFDAYTDFARRFPTEKYVSACGGGKSKGRELNIKSIFDLKSRETFTSQNFKLHYTDEDWIDFYVDMRNMEEHNVFDHHKIKKLKRNAKLNHSSLDNTLSIGYINEEFRKTFKSKYGGLNSLIKRQKLKEQSLETEAGLRAREEAEAMPSSTTGGTGGTGGASSGGGGSSGGY